MGLPQVTTMCPSHGMIFHKEITGRYKKEPEETLQERKELLEHRLSSIEGVSPQMGENHELWLVVEYLEHIIDFEINPPCGCDPPELPEGWDG